MRSAPCSVLSAPTRLAAAASLLVFTLLGACGGKQLGEPDGGTFTGPDGAACVDINAASYDTSCTTASDCTTIQTGTVCSGSCGCGGTPVNTSGLARYQAATSGLSFEACPCAELPIGCVNGQCTTCMFTTTSGACTDGGETGFDAGPEAGDTGGGDGGGKTCVNIDVSSYDQSCNSAMDCFVIGTGDVCSGSCDCPDTPVNVSGQAQYNAAIAGIKFGMCGCPVRGSLACLGGMCALCGLPGQPPCPGVK